VNESGCGIAVLWCVAFWLALGVLVLRACR